MRRYALAALVEASGLSEAALGRAVGLSGSTLVKARRDGLVESAADRYATRAGLPTVTVWPDFGLEACESCAAMYVPRQKGQRYCSSVCGARERRRRWRYVRYHSDPVYAESLRARRRAAYVECRDYERARQRRYDRARRAA